MTVQMQKRCGTKCKHVTVRYKVLVEILILRGKHAAALQKYTLSHGLQLFGN